MSTTALYHPALGISPCAYPCPYPAYPTFTDLMAEQDREQKHAQGQGQAQQDPGGPSRLAGQGQEGSDARKAIRRACDQCHVRKLKCNGEEPCMRCTKSRKPCTFLKPVLPKGPAPKRTGKRLSSDKTAGPSRPKRGSHSSDTSELTFDFEHHGLEQYAGTASGGSLLGDLSALPEQPNDTNQAGPTTANASRTAVPTWLADFNTSNTNNGPLVNDTWPQMGVVPAPTQLQQQQYTLGHDEYPAFPPDETGDALNLDDLLALTPSFERELASTADQLLSWQGGPSLSAPIDQPPPQPVTINVPSSAFTSFLNPTPLFPSSGLSFAPPEEISPLLTLTLDTLIKPQLEVFFERIYSMMPVFSRSEIMDRLSQPQLANDKPFIALILGMTALSLVHPLQPHEMVSKMTRGRQATMLLDEACRLTSKWDHGCGGSVEGVLTSYLMFGTLFELGYQDGARLRLREAISLGESMRIEQPRSYIGMSQVEARRRMRMFWILAVTERAYALQRSGHLVFEGAINTHLHHNTLTYPTQTPGQRDPVSHSLRHLALIFSHIDQTIISCWNGKCAGTTCTSLTPARVVAILRKLQGSAEQVFGADIGRDLEVLDEVQKADLLITWQWIRNRIWRLAAVHGLTWVGGAVELAPDYIFDVGERTAEICKTLSYGAMEAHGTGFVEKLYDIASVVAEALRSMLMLRDPSNRIRAHRGVQTIQTLFAYVARHRAGTTDFAGQLGETVKASMKLLTSA